MARETLSLPKSIFIGVNLLSLSNPRRESRVQNAAAPMPFGGLSFPSVCPPFPSFLSPSQFLPLLGVNYVCREGDETEKGPSSGSQI